MFRTAFCFMLCCCAGLAVGACSHVAETTQAADGVLFAIPADQVALTANALTMVQSRDKVLWFAPDKTDGFGQYKTTEFVRQWNQRAHRFYKKPVHAVLSVGETENTARQYPLQLVGVTYNPPYLTWSIGTGLLPPAPVNVGESAVLFIPAGE